MSAPSAKRAKGDDEASGGGDPLDGVTQEVFDALMKCQDRLEKIQDEAADEIKKIEAKFNSVMRPVQVARGEQLRKIPLFWLTVVSCRIMIFILFIYFDPFIIVLLLFMGCRRLLTLLFCFVFFYFWFFVFSSSHAIFHFFTFGFSLTITSSFRRY
jgi:hypothetical protein